MGFHDYPPRLDTANLPHIPVYRWRILMKTGRLETFAADLVKSQISSCRHCWRVKFAVATEQRKKSI